MRMLESQPDGDLSVLPVSLDPTVLRHSLPLADRWNDCCKIVGSVNGYYSMSVT